MKPKLSAMAGCAAVLALAAFPARAENQAAPRLSTDLDRLTFPTRGGTATLTIRNTGNAPLDVMQVRVVEEGFEKKSQELKARGPVFTVTSQQGAAGADAAGGNAGGAFTGTILAPGQSTELLVAYRPTGKQQQAFGSLQIVTDDTSLAPEVWSSPPGRGNAKRGVAGVSLVVKGGFLRSNALPIMVFFPLLGIAALFLVPRRREDLVKWVAFASTLVPLAVAVYLYFNYDRSLGVSDGGWGLQFVSHLVWIERFNIEFFMGTDGLSILMLLLTALVSAIACISSFSISKHVRGYFAMFLLLETGMMGTFAALDFFLFYVFWEVMLLPMYFLIGIWGGPRKEYAAIKFFLYTLAGSVLMLLALIALYFYSGTSGVLASGAQLSLVNGTPAAHTFDLMKLTHINSFAAAPLLLGAKFTYMVWVGLFIGFAIKVPMFPFHTWLPDAHVEAPTAISVILAGVLLKMGTYGMFRFNFAMLPDATEWARLTVAVFGVINILYGAFCAMAQTDLKKLVAYSSVSHMGYCLLGMAALTEQGMAGAIMQMFNHGTITAMLFLLVGVIYDRAHTRGVNEFGGVATVMPRYAAFFGFAFMASLGLPGLSGFIGEALVFIGAFNVYRVLTILAVTGVVVTAAYHLWAIQRIHLGQFKEKWREALKLDMSPRETTMLVPLAVIVLLLGFYPMPALDLMSTGVKDLQDLLANHQGAVRMVATSSAALLGGAGAAH
ncbi:MAG: NADH-quinone oxidoreductase subunit M [Pseudomonadota bacterium]